jgi:hypothetical protein
MIVEFDVFSGRPNPTWSLSAAQITELKGALEDLPPADKPVSADELGYRGFIISNPGRAAGMPPKIVIFGGVVTTTDGVVRSCRDVHRIEHRLLLQAAEYGYKALADAVLRGMPDS